MNIRISTLVLTIAIFEHFAELNATDPGEGSSTTVQRRGRGRPRGSGTTRTPGQVQGRPQTTRTDQDQFQVANTNGGVNAAEPRESSSAIMSRVVGRRRGSKIDQDQFRIAGPNDGPADRTVHYKDIEIRVWLDHRRRVRKAIYPNNYIPQAAYYLFNNILVRTMDLDNVRLVAYMNERGALIGIRGPRRTGQGYTLEPNALEWYINYVAKRFKVAVRNSVPIGISLMPENVHDPGKHSSEIVSVSGIHFKVFKGPDEVMTGAELVSS